MSDPNPDGSYGTPSPGDVLSDAGLDPKPSPTVWLHSPFVDQRHVLFVGWVLGLAMQAGLPVRPVVDAAGDYTNRLSLDLGGEDAGYIVELIVPSPPADWTLS